MTTEEDTTSAIPDYIQNLITGLRDLKFGVSVDYSDVSGWNVSGYSE